MSWTRKLTRPGTVLVALFVLLTSFSSAASAQQADASPTASPLPPSFDLMGPPPPGANDWSCTPSAEHPRPVVLVHGTNMDMESAWSELSPDLAAQGYCVFALDYGRQAAFWDPNYVAWGMGDIAESAKEVAAFVDIVRSTTGAAQVDMVGHSQGGVVARQYLKFDGGADAASPENSAVHRLVTLGATNHGTNFNGLQQLFLIAQSLGLPRVLSEQLLFGQAGSQQLIGSSLLTRLNANGETLPGIDYTVIASRFDDVVTPPERTFLDDHGTGSVTNEWVQDTCPDSTTSHLGLTTDPAMKYVVSSALDPSYSESHTPTCT
ncbi:alpha/beta fold hydrolase [Rhodococcus sp. IEGM 1370]|uniref:esterase/lipase family protein n=1 Tax=Rhodococcus sp. IEGM 1370 TaxID=3082222 RepID=UPI002955DC9A|nr:alpha/beta fold hydrolase [Rhodococcus sp. IEGM 1370]MDV8075439.1 alpha/beta fold hydrolase [Rhodococcus sp. IEGM 1370]